MEFYILGPLEMRVDGQSLPLRGRIVPRLLAALLLEADRAISRSRLAHMVWDDDPPASARKQLQNAVSVIRGLLSDIDGVRLDSACDGYRLRMTSRNHVDAHRFHHIVAEAKAVLTAGRDAAALARFRSGLALWRGPALTELHGRAFESAARQLEEARLAAIEERIDLELSTTRDGPAISELRELLANQPYRQRMVGQLMRALYRQGRTGDALTAYEEFRRRLTDDLGIDPSPQLRDLHAEILREDPALDRPPVRAAAPAVPAQLPRCAREFSGRARQLSIFDELLAEVDRNAVTVCVTGIGGIGKTAVALHWAHRALARFPDGQLYINLRGYSHMDPLSPWVALCSVLRSLGVGDTAVPSDVDEAAGLYRSLLAGKRMLIILDNARDTAQVRPLLPGTAGSFTIVTSRNRLTGLVALDSAYPLPLEVLSYSESHDLFAGLVSPDRLSIDPAATDRLIEACAGLPLALRIAAANLLSYPDTDIDTYMDEVRRVGALELLTVADDPPAAVTATFEHSLQALPPEARRFLLGLSLIPGKDFSGALATQASERSSAPTRRLLTSLTDAHLLEQHRAGRFRLHDLLQQFARRRARESSESDADRLAERAVDCYCATTRTVFDLYTTGWLPARLQLSPEPETPGIALTSTEQARAWVDTELSNLIAAVDHAAAAGRDEQAVGIAVLLGAVLRTIGYARRQLQLGHAALPAARRLPDQRGLYFVRHDLASVQRYLRRLPEALRNCEQDVELTRRLGDPGLESVSLSLLGEIHRRSGNLAAAEHHALAGLELRAKHGEGLDESIGYLRLGLIHGNAGKVDAALDAYHRALAIAEETGDPWNQTAALGNTGHLLLRSDQPQAAVHSFEKSLELLERAHLTTTTLAADQHWGYADALHRLGEPDRARRHWDTAADILLATGLITGSERAAIAADPRPTMPRILAD